MTRSGHPRATGPNNKLTVLLLSSPSLQDPSTDTIDNTLESLRRHAREVFSSCALVHALDGPAPTLPSKRKSAFDEFKRRVLAKWPLIRQCQAPSWGRLTGLLNYSMRRCVTTPFVLVNQDDLALRRRLPVFPLLNTFRFDGNVNWVGLLDRTVADVADWLPKGCARRSTAVRTEGGFCWFSMLRRYAGNNSVPLTEVVGFTDKLHMTRRAWYLAQLLPKALSTARGVTWGSRVQLHGLSARADLNGQHGIVVSPLDDSARCQVRLAQRAGFNGTGVHRKEIRIKAANLRALQAKGTRRVAQSPEWHYAIHSRAWALGTLRAMTGPLDDDAPWPASFYELQGTFVLGDPNASHIWYEDLDRRCKRGAVAECDKRDSHPRHSGTLQGEFFLPDGCESPCHPTQRDIEEEVALSGVAAKRPGGGAREQELPREQRSDQLSGGETFLRYGLWAVLLLLLCACALTYYLVRRKRASPPQPRDDALNTTIDASSSNGADEAGGVYAASREVKVS